MYVDISTVLIPTLLMTSCLAKQTVHLRGAGASFPSAVYRDWISTFKLMRSHFVDLRTAYDIVGSGRGKEMIMNESPDVEYGASDSILTDEEYAKHPDLQMIPTMAG